MLAGAAVLFVLGSAIVAFRGWPQIATGPATTEVAAPLQQPGSSRVARRLAAVLRQGTAGGATAGAPPVIRRGVVGAGRLRSAVRGGTTSTSVTPGAAGPGTGLASAGPSSGSCGGAACGGPGSPNLVTRLANTVGHDVSNIGSSAGTQVGSGADAVGNDLNGASPQGAGAVRSAGEAAGTAVSGTASTAGSVVTQVGNRLGGGH